MMAVGLRTASLIGAPTDVGASDRGSSMGPEALRVAGIERALVRRGLKVLDRGNLSGPPNPVRAPVQGYRHLAEVLEWNRQVHAAVYRDLADGHLPILLGGDHSLSIGSISAVARHCRENGRALRILWLDAHADFNTCELSPSGNLHGMPVACLCGFGPAELVQLGGRTPAVDPRWIRQVGIRSVDSGEKRFVHEQELEVFDMRYIDEMGVRQAMELALADLPTDTHLHVSFDVDFLDPEIAPGVGTTVPGGPSYREAQLCMEMIADTGRVASLDVVELNPALDVRNKTATLAVDLIESLFGKSTLMRRPAVPHSRTISEVDRLLEPRIAAQTAAVSRSARKSMNARTEGSRPRRLGNTT
ncbi:MAG TPA: arginase [Steroidobacteraceae bacterium]|nr:arginase [Steroidobacteraceae bacterium]